MKRTIHLWITPLKNGLTEIIYHQLTLSTARFSERSGDGWHVGGFINHRFAVEF